MKSVAIALGIGASTLLMLPVFLLADGGALGCTGIAQIDAALATIRTIESGGDYAAQAAGSSASGAYQFTDPTWADFAGFAEAWLAPPDVQDAKAIEHVTGILEGHDGDITTVPVIWYIGHLPSPESAEWDSIPRPDAGNVLSPREYQTKWLDEYETQLALIDGERGGCVPGGSILPNADGFAIPGPPGLFATADVSEPHHDYPAWDWLIPLGTPIYAVAGGRVATVQYWPYNWWDRGCGTSSTGCRTCGIGVTIEDVDGTRWAYCHGDAVHVAVGQEVAAGTQILTSGNTGRSGAPHLHLQITTSDGVLRCPQRLLVALRTGRAIAASDLPAFGCFFGAT